MFYSEMFILVNIKVQCRYVDRNMALMDARLVRLKSKNIGIVKSTFILCYVDL
jgi:hypothetical protein